MKLFNRIHFRILFSLIALIISNVLITDSYAQQQPPDQYLVPISPVTPNAASLGQYGDIPVSMYTGVPDIQIPIYQIKVGGITIPISLSYHGEGVKVEDYSSWVGTGWSLNAGGVINREQRGDPDENMIDYYSSNAATFNQILNPSVSAATKQNTANTQASSTGPTVDMESDIFNFNFGGSSGKFFMNPLGNIYTIPATKYKIQQTGRITIINGMDNSAFKEWIITDNNGVNYYFGSNAVGTVNAQEVVSNLVSGGGSTPSVNSWFLTQIITPGKDTINFNYQTYSYSTAVTTSNSEYPGYEGFSSASTLTYTTALRLTNITYPNGKITFTAGGNREDLPGDQTLDHISIYENDENNTRVYKLLKTYQLYNNNPAGILSSASPDLGFRLRLDSVTMFSSDKKRIGAYGLAYNNFNLLPNKTSTAQDLWGYFNGQTSNPTLVPKYTFNNSQVFGDANREADSVYSLYGSLNSITYPTGGYSQFQFETNKATIMQDSLLSFFISSAPTIQDKSFSFKLSNNTGTTTTATSATFTVGTVVPNTMWNFVGHVLPYGSVTCANTPVGNNTDAYTNPCFSAWLIGTQTNGTIVNSLITFDANDVQVYPGTYQIKIQYNSGSTGQAYVTANWQEEPSAQSQTNEWFVGGLRIKSITNYDPVTGNTVVKTYRYTYLNNNRSSGTVENLPVYAYVVPYDEINGLLYENLLFLSSHSQSSLLTTQGSIVGYANVIEQVDNNGTLGQNVYTYTSDDDFVNDPSLYQDGGIGASIQFPFPVSTNFDWKRGLLKQKQVFANLAGTITLAGNTNNSYIFSPSTDVNYVEIPNVKFSRVSIGYQPNQQTGSAWSSANPSAQILYGCAYAIYYTTSGSVYNDTTREQLYDNVNYSNATTKTTTQLLDPQTLENASQSVINSDGKTIIKQFKYPLNYNITTATDTATQGLQNLINNNKVKEPVEILEISQDTSGNQTVTGGTILIYYNNKPEVKQVLELNVSQPIPIASFTQSSVNGSGNFIYDSRYEVRLSADKYSPKLQLAQETKVPGLHSTYIWDYNGEIPIATVSSADSTDVAYTSFEADGTGNWTIASALRDTTQGITGTRSYVLSNGNISKTGLTTTTTYVVSYWTKNTTPLTITGTQTGYPKQGPTINGWTYFEHEVKGRSTITLSGTGNIDEVRLYPSTAQMKTYTYDPLVGITSTADAKNQIEYYEYDTFQRLINIKDQYGNIVKHMSYHYQTLPY